jgi:FkbM family methyltransferase
VKGVVAMLSTLNYQVRSRPWLGRLVLKAIPDLKWQINVAPLGRLAIRLRQHRMFWLRPPLVHEGFMLGSLQRLLREGEVAYDVGANIGLYSRFMVQVFKASHVYAFEPMANNCSVLAENLEIAGCAGRVTIIPCAIGDQDGTCDFQVDRLTSNSGALDAVNRGKASASHSQYGLPAALERVTASRLDTVLETRSFLKPDVIKLDVEGAEAMALEGARHLLSRYRPRLVIELHGAEAARRVLEILWNLDYHCFGYLDVNGVSTYKKLTPADLDCITELYSLHYLVASTTPDDLLRPIEDFSPV